MNKAKANQASITQGLIRLRKERRLTQAELALFLGISQQRLSEIERGSGSISAEQLVALLQEFNLPLNYFVPIGSQDEELKLQNALARLGAKYLRESTDVIVPERWDHPDAVIIATLYDHPSARLVSALAPVIVLNSQKINFNKIERTLHDLGFANRLYWLQEATLQAVQNRLKQAYLAKNLKSLYKRAQTTLLGINLDRKLIEGRSEVGLSEDLLDPDILSAKTRDIVVADRDELARKWKIITRFRQRDFDHALVESESYV